MGIVQELAQNKNLMPFGMPRVADCAGKTLFYCYIFREQSSEAINMLLNLVINILYEESAKKLDFCPTKFFLRLIILF